VTATVTGRDESAGAKIVAGFGGGARRALRLRLENRGSAPLTGLRAVASVGRSSDDGEPIDARAVPPIAPNSSALFTIPFDIAAPAFGDYVVRGKVFGAGAPVQFSTEVDNDPWMLWLLLPVGLIAVAELLRARDRRRRQQAARTLRTVPHATTRLAQSSPEVGVGVGNGCATSPYDPRSAPDVANGQERAPLEPVPVRIGA
jgi:hypothetical protein